jgi:hypothetical protein
MTKILRLTSGEFDHQLVTKEAYQEIQLQMSTGDYHQHTAYEVDINQVSPIEQVLDLLDPSTGELGAIEADVFQTELEVKKAKAKKRGPAEVVSITLAKSKEADPREVLLRNQRRLFGYIAPVVSITKYKKGE